MAKTPSGGFRVGNVNYGRFSGVRPGAAANENLTERARIKALKDAAAETEKMLKESTKDYRLNSGKYAYEKPATSALGRAAGNVAGAVARTAGRLAGPAGALVGMTTPTGDKYDDKPSGPLMSGSKSRGPGGGPLSAPNRTQPSRPQGGIGSDGGLGGPSRGGGDSRSGGYGNSAGPGGPSGPNSGPSRSGGSSGSMGPSGPSRSGSPSGGPGGPSGPNSGPSRSSSPSSGPGGPSGPNSGPSRSASAPKGTERFAKGSLVMSKAAKKSYFSKDAVNRTRGMYNSKPSRGKK